MSFQTDVGTAVGQLASDVLAALGVLVSYQVRGNAAITLLKAQVGDETHELEDVLGTFTEVTTRKIFIPQQTNYPPANGINVDDVVTLANGVSYEVKSFELDQSAAGYMLTVKHHQVLKVGHVR